MILVTIVIGLAVVPLLMVKDGNFIGADDKAKKAITELIFMTCAYKSGFRQTTKRHVVNTLTQ